MSTTSFAVVGGGSWGTAVAGLLAERHEVVLWAMEPEVVDGINDHHRNPLFHPDVDLPPGLRATTDVGRGRDRSQGRRHGRALPVRPGRA